MAILHVLGIDFLVFSHAIMQALESEAVIRRFHSVYEKLSQTLDGMPYEELGISDEEKEQVSFFLVRRKIK